MSERIQVVAAAVFNQNGCVLIAERPAGKHLAGRWEFPGGKIAAGESDHDALRRELREELGIEVAQPEHFMTLTHQYADRGVELRLYVVPEFAGSPRGLDGQRLQWVVLDELDHVDLLEADAPFVRALQQRGPPAR